MFDKIKEFNEFPQSVKISLILLFVSWAYFFLYLYFWYAPKAGDPIQRQVISGIAICVCILMIKNWARVLCILCNVLIIMEHLLPFYEYMLKDDYYHFLLIGLIILLFTATTYFLLVKTTADFFKANSKKTSEENLPKDQTP